MAEADEINRKFAEESLQRAKAAAKQGLVDEVDRMKNEVARLGNLTDGAQYYSLTENHRGLAKSHFIAARNYLIALQARLRDWDK